MTQKFAQQMTCLHKFSKFCKFGNDLLHFEIHKISEQILPIFHDVGRYFLMSFGWSYVHKYLFATYISCQVTDMWSKFHKSKIGTKSCFAGAFHIHRQKSAAAAGRYTHFTRQKNRFASYSTTQYYYSLFPNGKQSRVKTTFSQSSRARMFYGNFLWWFLLWHTNYHLVNVCDLALKH